MNEEELRRALYDKGRADMLNTIRVRVEKLHKMCDKNDLNLGSQYIAFGMVLDILDEYKAEMESEDGILDKSTQ